MVLALVSIGVMILAHALLTYGALMAVCGELRALRRVINDDLDQPDQREVAN
jgi:hypothetical protein